MYLSQFLDFQKLNLYFDLSFSESCVRIKFKFTFPNNNPCHANLLHPNDPPSPSRSHRRWRGWPRRRALPPPRGPRRRRIREKQPPRRNMELRSANRLRPCGLGPEPGGGAHEPLPFPPHQPPEAAHGLPRLPVPEPQQW